jgi:multidrug resistance efflux pump
MLEFFLCSLVTIFPDYLVRRFVQGKRWGSEINFVSMWYELRWGITACVILTISLITLIFYYHPSTTNASPFFRTITILPEGGGRVEEVFVENGQAVEAGEPLFSLHESSQLAAVELARGQVVEIEAQFKIAESDLAAMNGLVRQAEGSLEQVRNELRLKRNVEQRSKGAVSAQEFQRLENSIASREGALAAAEANNVTVESQISTVLPARLESARNALEQAQVELAKTTIYAGVSGNVHQFFLQPGDYVNPILRPAGLLIPSRDVESGRHMIQAGFSQLTAQVIQRGTLAEVSCLSKPFKVIPMVVTYVQDIIASGQLRPTDTLVDVQDRARPGTLTVWMEPLYEGGMDGIIPGTKCIANAYSYHHEEIASGELGFMNSAYLHMVDAVGVVHAIILRIQTLVLPVKMLVFSGH